MKKLLLLIPLALTPACKKDEGAAKPASTETKAPAETKTPTEAKPAADNSRFDIKVTEKGFEPGETSVAAGKPVTLVFERKTDQTCIKEVVLTMDDGTKVQKELPMNTPVEIAATFPKAGKLSYACGMDMMKGTIIVQ